MNRPLIGMIRKEFIQVFRDPNMIRLIFVVPIIQLFLFGYVVNTDVKKLALDVYDFDQSQMSRELIETMKTGNYFIPREAVEPIYDIEHAFRGGDAELALVIPSDFSRQLTTKNPVTIGVLADGSNSNSSAIGQGYIRRAVQRFSEQNANVTPPVSLRTSVLYNPEGESVYFMVPGIVATLLTMITIMLTSMAIVREREQGTLEQLMVTPISKGTLLAGKLVPFAILGILVMSVALTLGILWFKIPFAGSPVFLFLMAALFLLTTLGIGLLISTMTKTQQQAMFFAWFFSIFAMLTSGLFTPVANMPNWLQTITYINPMRYFVEAVRGIMMKGAGPLDMLSDIVPLAILGPTIFTLAVFRFHKRNE